jgi:phage-related protein
MIRKTRPVSWIRAALREFETFPEGARSICLAALTIAAEGGKADIAKPMHGLGSGVFEIALPFKGDAFRVVTQCSSPMNSRSFMRSKRNLRRVSRHHSARSTW